MLPSLLVEVLHMMFGGNMCIDETIAKILDFISHYVIVSDT